MSEGAFAHALKLACLARAELGILHVAHEREDVHWTDFPRVRQTLERWGLLPVGSSQGDVVEMGLQVKKIIGTGTDPVHSILHHLEEECPNLVVLATHQREGLARWLSQAVAEPVARQSRAMTLFVPHKVEGFVSLESGMLTLQRIVIPVDKAPHPQPAIDAAYALAGALGCVRVSFALTYVGDGWDFPRVHVHEQKGWSWEKIIRHGDVVEQILHTTTDCSANLIVMTTQGRHGFLDALRGSTTERVLRGAQCPVLAIPAV